MDKLIKIREIISDVKMKAFLYLMFQIILSKQIATQEDNKQKLNESSPI